MSNQAYVGMTKRTFEQALIYLLENDYALLGCRRILELLVQDVQGLIDQFYPTPARLRSGWMVLTGTKAIGSKAHPGQSAADHQLVTLAWPVLLPEDIEQLAAQPDTAQNRREWLRKRLVRIVEHGWNHPAGPVLLTQADLATMTGIERKLVGRLLQEARQMSDKPLLTKGYYFDQGMRPTHKTEIIALYEQGLDETDIARQSGHALDSVGRYIRDYERVKLLLQQGIPVEQVSRLINMQPNVVNSYVELVHKYHPNLVPDAKLPTQI
jgi:hypothetical protein